ncbi:hypothetical protein C0J52_23844 [Blattella germanica]|nr:hypothetical protein C0J52_23844 [Blattella germanica]
MICFKRETVNMGVHKTTEHESGYFEDEEDDEEVARRVICVSNNQVTRDNSVDNLEEISCCEKEREARKIILSTRPVSVFEIGVEFDHLWKRQLRKECVIVTCNGTVFRPDLGVPFPTSVERDDLNPFERREKTFTLTHIPPF